VDDEERTLPPSPRKLQRAREAGQVPRSSELPAAVVFLVGIFILLIFGKKIFELISNMFVFMYTQARSLEINDTNLYAIFVLWAKQLGKVILLIALPILVAGVAANILQVGFLFTTRPLMPKFSMLNIVAGFKRLFSKENLIKLPQAVVKFILLGLIGYFTLKGEFTRILSTINTTTYASIGIWGNVAFKLALRLGIAFLILAIIDFIYQRHEYMKKMRMTPHEAKEEMKQYEGDPRVRSERQRRHMMLVRRIMMKELPKADVVITNPTHVAVALRYDPSKMSAPMVVAKGMRKLAQKIIKIARKYDIPIVENPEIAWALYRTVEVGEEVPVKFYKAIAEILAYVYRMKGKTL